jgi:hypothetical protein
MSRLDSIQLAIPCPLKFTDMKGDERVRFCAQCKMNVYDLSEMTEKEALELVTTTEQRICVTFYRRDDGTVITRDCEGGFSSRFWTKYGTFERKGLIGMAVAAVLSVIFASAATVFGDNLHALSAFGRWEPRPASSDTRVDVISKASRLKGEMRKLPTEPVNEGY